ncbi:MAG TPA: sigma-70 family RNA polymerase sigma factor [Pyrinomonadaceae bacterium]|jgi:RNA polymerase sigma factor (sigma-70 family)
MTPEVQSLTVEQLVSGLSDKNRPPDEASDYCEEIIHRFEPLLRKAWHRGAFNIEYPEYVQDVFLSLFRWLPQLRSPKAFPGYFRRVALSVAAAHARKSAHSLPRTTLEFHDQVYQIDEALSTPIYIKAYLERLPPREGKVLTMLYINDFEIKEIAKEMNLTDTEVRYLKSRALKRLREILGEDTKTLKNPAK